MSLTFWNTLEMYSGAPAPVPIFDRSASAGSNTLVMPISISTALRFCEYSTVNFGIDRLTAVRLADAMHAAICSAVRLSANARMSPPSVGRSATNAVFPSS